MKISTEQRRAEIKEKMMEGKINKTALAEYYNVTRPIIYDDIALIMKEESEEEIETVASKLYVQFKHALVVAEGLLSHHDDKIKLHAVMALKETIKEFTNFLKAFGKVKQADDGSLVTEYKVFFAVSDIKEFIKWCEPKNKDVKVLYDQYCDWKIEEKKRAKEKEYITKEGKVDIQDFKDHLSSTETEEVATSKEKKTKDMQQEHELEEVSLQ